MIFFPDEWHGIKQADIDPPVEPFGIRRFGSFENMLVHVIIKATDQATLGQYFFWIILSATVGIPGFMKLPVSLRYFDPSCFLWFVHSVRSACSVSYDQAYTGSVLLSTCLLAPDPHYSSGVFRYAMGDIPNVLLNISAI